MQKEIYLTIEGEPEQAVQAWHRGNRDDESPDSAPVIFTGKLGSDGRVTVRVPRAYLCVGFPEKSGCQPHHFENETGDNVTVSLAAKLPSDQSYSPDDGSDGGEKEITEPADHDYAAQQETFAADGETLDETYDEGEFAAAPRPWRVAQSLLTLRTQINNRFPNRSKASDGTIGDAAHASRSSDHNPWIIDGANGVVSAMDITHDPAHGCSAETLAEAIRAARDARVKYIIWNRRIANSSPIGAAAAWQWRSYTGANGHTHHIHISVKSDRAHYDSTAPWSI